ncbi:hypothetical protein NDU88_010517 [Pleurodeles waltl]|uniref:Uncharacterized protein n=1 Tax=Pleurodeles waltl TaxID=8319 RepID=A0AAV7QUL4_PLEWA|nr:hypothetical protein NDU88_010517 [Pleurodeles waltl]
MKKKRVIHIGDMVLVRNRRWGSKCMLPFEKDPWVVSGIKGIMVTVKGKQETVKGNISFFKLVRMTDCEVAIEKNSSPASSREDDDGGRVDHSDNGSTSQSQGVAVDDPLSFGLRSTDVQNSEPPQISEHEVPDLVPVSSPPSRQGLEHYSLRPHPSRSTKLQGFVVH